MNFVEIKKSDLTKSSLLNQIQKNNPVIVRDVPLYSDTTEEVIYLTESVVEGVVVLDDKPMVIKYVEKCILNTSPFYIFLFDFLEIFMYNN